MVFVYSRDQTCLDLLFRPIKIEISKKKPNTILVRKILENCIFEKFQS